MRAVMRHSAHKIGATSFYVVAISTLILVILATSFATAMMAEVMRSSNDDIAESAYDSALAGIEEAKLAYENYRNCLKSGTPYNIGKPADLDQPGVTCEKIVWWMKNPDCDMVAHILGRISPDAQGEVQLERTAAGSTNGSLDQAYTCVMMKVNPGDTYGLLNSTTPYRIINVENINPKDLKSITLSWHLNTNDPQTFYSKFGNNNNSSILFTSLLNNSIPTPAILSLQIIQTADSFTIDQLFGDSNGSKTNRATMFFVPNDKTNISNTTSNINYIPIYKQSSNTNELSANDVTKTNNPEEKNKPFLVYCNTGNTSDFACSVKITLPTPISDSETSRNDETFKLLVSAPYGGQDTVFAISYDCGSGSGSCASSAIIGLEDKDTNLNAGQVIVDSTGRSGDMYKRIEARLDPVSSVTYDGFPFYAIQAEKIDKNITVETETGGIDPPTPPEPGGNSCERSVQSMQEWLDGEKLAVGKTIRLRDDRDSQCYSVSKIDDGKIWMLSNLNLKGGTTLNSTTTDFAPGYRISSNASNRWSSGNKMPSSDTSGFVPQNNNPNIAYVHNSLNVNPVSNDEFNSTVCGGSGNNIPCSSYYSWDVATLGSGRNFSNDGAKAPYSICPYGWRLPASNSKEQQPSGNKNLLSGYYSDGLFDLGGVEGYYWTSTVQSSNNAWAIQSNGSSSSTIGSSRSLGYAVRCVYVEPVTHTLTIDPNDGTGAKNSVSCIGRRYGCSVTIPKTTLTRNDYVFMGYGASASATNIVYRPGDTYTFAPGVTSATIYAVWRKATYTIEYHGNYGVTSGNATVTYDRNVEIDKTINLTPNPFRRSGYVFQGWATSPTGSVVYADKASVNRLGKTDGAVVKLYAVWRAQYRVTYSLNGGSGTTPASQTVLNGNRIRLPTSNRFSRTNYYFDGWRLNNPTSGTVYRSNSYYTVTSNVTFYAKWVRETYQIIFNGNGGARNDGVTQTTQTVNRGANVTLAENKFVREGYTFQGWATSPTGSVVYADKASVKDIGTPTTPASLYAVWEEQITYEVIYRQNCNSDDTTTKVYQVNPGSQHQIISKPSDFICSGYSFDGWQDADWPYNSFDVGSTITVDNDITINAKWKE